MDNIDVDLMILYNMRNPAKEIELYTEMQARHEARKHKRREPNPTPNKRVDRKDFMDEMDC